MPNSYPRDRIFNQHLTTIKDSYISERIISEYTSTLCFKRTVSYPEYTRIKIHNVISGIYQNLKQTMPHPEYTLSWNTWYTQNRELFETGNYNVLWYKNNV